MDAEQRKNHVKARLYCPDFKIPAGNVGGEGGSDEGESGGCGGGESVLSDSITCDLPSDQAKHARTVLRLGVGDWVEVFNGEGEVGRGKIVVSGKKGMVVEVSEGWVQERKQGGLIVVTALPKGSRVDGMIDMLGQLGVDEVWCMTSERSVVDPRQGKLDKLQARAVEASKQSGRSWLMKVRREVVRFEDVLSEIGDGMERAGEQGGSGGAVKLIMHFGGVGLDEVKGMLSDEGRSGGNDVVLLVGPEGGWTDGEVEMAEAKGFVRWTCGAHVMRIETAAVVGAGVLGAL
ncbi:Ribosomal RNA small subunit methyltransferase E [Poriferisphaera corsica]|uniref:Ribosomal RNA small subunit methyltransferase E n=1 Tax=Poriferisphaera corsica TaxID=2528020 RepID=A0A517YPW7_9BACT|nr:RsmE family RNA methyltransferase [Poriferisphaera corsica]QDU32261.1 Ribosomal RNA small subunit methyltransferase E [Poriferisphaera corsica]